jgi:hypothetical protein
MKMDEEAGGHKKQELRVFQGFAWIRKCFGLRCLGTEYYAPSKFLEMTN